MEKRYFEDYNYPGEIYIVPEDLVSRFKEYMAGEGAALVETKRRNFGHNYEFCYITLKDESAYNPFKWEHETKQRIEKPAACNDQMRLHCQICPYFSQCTEWD